MANSLAGLQPKTVMEMGLTCSICWDIFTDPHLLPCGHTFCRTCLLGMETHIMSMGFRCPECRADFGSSIPLQKNFAVASIAEDFRNTQQRKNMPVKCDCCIAGNQATAVKTCLTCIVSMCKEHINPHLELPAFREHRLTEPLRNLRKMKCPRHEVYKRYCSASQTYVCRWCDIQARSTDEAMKLKTINKDMMELLEKTLDGCVASMRKLQIIMAKDQRYFGWTALRLMLVGIILAYFASMIGSSSPHPWMGQQAVHFPSKEIEEINRSLKKHDRLLAQIYYKLNGNVLDPNSASPLLRISDDFMSVERQNDRLPVAPHPHRFDTSPQVLTTQCVSTGVHHWEVEAEGYWDIAVSYSSIERKNKTHCTFGMNNKSWSLTQNKHKQLLAFRSGLKVDLRNRVLSQNRVIVAVDYEEGNIVFWDAKKLHKPVYSFTARFTEPICLGFGLYLMDPPTRISIKNT